MGIAVAEEENETAGGSALACDGSVSKTTVRASGVWSSFGLEAGAGSAETGGVLSAGRTQHLREVSPCGQLDVQHDFGAPRNCKAASAFNATLRNAQLSKRTTAVFRPRDIIVRTSIFSTVLSLPSTYTMGSSFLCLSLILF